LQATQPGIVLKILNNSRQHVEIGKHVKFGTTEAILWFSTRVTGLDSQSLEEGEASADSVTLLGVLILTICVEVRTELEQRLVQLATKERQNLMQVTSEYTYLFFNDKEGVLLCMTEGFHEIRTGDALR
jgi:hypothetical protein